MHKISKVKKNCLFIWKWKWNLRIKCCLIARAILTHTQGFKTRFADYDSPVMICLWKDSTQINYHTLYHKIPYKWSANFIHLFLIVSESWLNYQDRKYDDWIKDCWELCTAVQILTLQKHYYSLCVHIINIYRFTSVNSFFRQVSLIRKSWQAIHNQPIRLEEHANMQLAI